MYKLHEKVHCTCLQSIKSSNSHVSALLDFWLLNSKTYEKNVFGMAVNDNFTLSFDIPISPFWFVLASVQDKNSNPNNSSEDHSFIKQHFPSAPKTYQIDIFNVI